MDSLVLNLPLQRMEQQSQGSVMAQAVQSPTLALSLEMQMNYQS
jgi:hypothetical protein